MAYWAISVWVALIATVANMILSLVTYNPYICNNNDRLQQIVSEFKGFNVIFLPGTSRLSFLPSKSQQFLVKTHNIVAFDYNKKLLIVTKAVVV